MKIAITGAHCTGKTTLVEELEKIPELAKKFAFRGNITRKIKKSGKQINENGDDETQLLVIAQHIENYIPKDVILDRCALDGLVYTTYLYEKGKVSKQTLRIAEAVFENLEYDIKFYVKPEFEIIKDGVRSVEKEFQDRVAQLFEEYIESYKLCVVPITGTVAERVKTITETITAYKKYQKEQQAQENKLFKQLNQRLDEQLEKLGKESNE
jgi:nicotinamide riboside kinase